MTEITLYYADWCGHCKAFKPEWSALKTQLDKIGIKHSEFEADKNKEAIKDAKIHSFPTIYIKKDKDVIEYQGPRTANDILSFIGVEPKMDGGGVNYTKKYKKYKAKYMSLKKWMKKNGYM